MFFRAFFLLFALGVFSCGMRNRPTIVEDDAGILPEAPDAGRQRGMDPPNGFLTAVPIPADGGTRFGVSVTSAPDQFGHPLIAAVWDDPNGDGLRSDTRVFFTRWNGESNAFEPIKTIEVVGEIDLSHPNRQVSIARDAVSGRIGIAFVKAGVGIRLATSDDEGANFSLTTVGMDPGTQDPSNPQLALRNAATHLAYVTSTEQVVYRSRVQSTGTFTETVAPVTPGQATSIGPIALALDATGAPGLSYFTKGASFRATLAFWRPGTPTPSVIASSEMTDVLMPEARRPSVSLIFSGTVPRVAFHLLRADPVEMMPLPGMTERVTDSNSELWTRTATDASGTMWSAPVGMPRTGNMASMRFNSTQWYQAVVAQQNGALTVAGAFLSKGTTNTICGGGPKIAKSTDGSTFMTCAPNNTPFTFAGEWLSMFSHAPDRVTVVFFFDRRVSDQLSGGITMWREP